MFCSVIQSFDAIVAIDAENTHTKSAKTIQPRADPTVYFFFTLLSIAETVGPTGWRLWSLL